MKISRLLLGSVVLILASCSQTDEPSAAAQVNAIASDFVAGFYTQFPEEIYEVGYPDGPLDRFGDHSEAALAAWDARVDGWLADLNAIDVSSLDGTPEAITYVFARERMQALVDKRICHSDLWNISPTWTGWQFMIAGTLAVQPIETAAEREAALSRASDIGRFLNTEIANLRRGLDQGYLAAQANVDAVSAQVAALLDTPVQESPFFGPAARSDDAAFSAAYEAVLSDQVYPALAAYHAFLVDEYRGREAFGVGANPDGDACYEATARYWSSSDMSPEEIHRLGLAEIERIQGEMLAIAQEHFDTNDIKWLLEELRTNPEYTFADEDAILDFVNDAVERSRVAVADWFNNIPDAEVVVIASPAYEKDSGGGFYSAGSADGTRPGTIQVGTYKPTTISKAGMESLTFHEGYPGHHMQVSIALLNESLHPILRYMYVSGFAEGWGLYSESLANEMGLYSSPVTQMGRLSDEAWRAARLVVDPGIHVMGWSRQQAMDYMLEHTANSPDGIASEVDRYAAVPGQATSYLVGSLEIQRLRDAAERTMGDDFDIREFHDRVLVNGSVTLPIVKATIESWIDESR